MSTNKNKKGLSVGVAALILTVVAILCIACCILIPSSYQRSIAATEASLPESAISTYLQQIKNNEFDEAYQTSLFVIQHYNSKEDYSQALKAIYAGVDLNQVQYVPVAMEEEGHFYDLVYDNKYIATLKVIQVDGIWRASTLFEGDHEYIVEVPAAIRFTVNGQSINKNDCIEEKTTASNFNGLSSTKEAPLVNRYLFSNLINEPVIETESGYAVIKDVLSNTLYIGKQTEDSELEEVFIKAAQALAKYPTKDGSLSTITQMTISNSDFYNRIRTMDNQWYAAHNSAVFSNMTVHDIIMQSEDTMIGNVTFDYKISANSASKTYHCGYQLTFMNTSGSWKIAGIGIDNTMK